MSEKALTAWWKDHAPGFWRRIEHKFEDGWPDLLGFDPPFTLFVELKYCERWPIRAGIGLDPWQSDDRRRQAQSIWLWKTWEKGGYTYLAVKVRDELFLLPGALALEAARGQTQEWWRTIAVNATAGPWVTLRALCQVRYAELHTRTD